MVGGIIPLRRAASSRYDGRPRYESAVKGRLANYKVPKQVIVVDELPRNTMGKVLKNDFRASLIAVARGKRMSS